MKTFPGKGEPNGRIEKHLYESMLKFMGDVKGRCADIGKENIKMEYIKHKLGINVTQFDDYDFNFCQWSGNFDYVFCFEVIEHLQNPLHFMLQLKNLINENGTIFLTTPNRPKFLWGNYHFHEITPKRMIKWIIEPLGLVCTRKQRLWVPFDWWFYFTGIRPLLRLFLNTKYIYEIKKYDDSRESEEIKNMESGGTVY